MRRWIEFLPLVLVRMIALRYGERFNVHGHLWANGSKDCDVLFRVTDPQLKPERTQCQYAADVGMTEYRCVGKCQYALTEAAEKCLPAAHRMGEK